MIGQTAVRKQILLKKVRAKNERVDTINIWRQKNQKKKSIKKDKIYRPSLAKYRISMRIEK